MRALLLFVVASAAICLGGCSIADWNTKAKFTPGNLQTSPAFEAYILKQEPTPAYPDPEATKSIKLDVAFAGVTDPTQKRAVARAYAIDLVAQSDVICDTYLRRLKGRDSIITYTLHTAGYALTGAGGLATPTRSAQILSALGGFANNSAAGIEHDVLDQKHFDIIYNANMRGRSAEREKIDGKVKAGYYDGLPLSSIRADIGRYNRQCGISYGLDVISLAVDGNGLTTGDEAPPRSNGGLNDVIMNTYPDIELMRARAIACVTDALTKAQGSGDTLIKGLAVNNDGVVTIGTCPLKPGVASWQDTVLKAALDQLTADAARKDTTVTASWKNNQATAPDDVTKAINAAADKLASARNATFLHMQATATAGRPAKEIADALKAGNTPPADPMLTRVAEDVALSIQLKPDDIDAALVQAIKSRDLYLSPYKGS